MAGFLLSQHKITANPVQNAHPSRARRIVGGGWMRKSRMGFAVQKPKKSEMLAPQCFAVSYYNKGAKWLPYNSDEVWRKRGSLEIYIDMVKDSQIKACIETKKNLMIGQGYEIECEDDMLREFVEMSLTEWYSGNFNEDLQQLLSAMAYGFSIFEKVYRVENGKLLLDKLVSIPQDSIKFNIDDFGNVLSIEQASNMGKKNTFSPHKFVILSWNYSNSNPYGNSDLQAAYEAWFSKRQIISYLNMFLERYGMPYIFAKYDAGNEGLRDELTEIVESLQSATGAVFPAEVTVDLHDVNMQAADSFVMAISMFNRDISAALLVPDLLGFNETQGGSYSLGEEQIKVFQLNIDRHRSMLQDVINRQLIKQLIDLNFANVKEYPKIVFKPVEKDLVLDRITAYTTLLSSLGLKPRGLAIDKILEDLKLPFKAGEYDEEIEELQTGAETNMEEENGENTEQDSKNSNKRPESDEPGDMASGSDV